MQESSMEADKKYLRSLWKSYFDNSDASKSVRPFSCNARRPIDFEYKKSSPVYLLRDQLNLRKSTSRAEKAKYKSKQYLQERLDDNCNVFMAGHEVDRRDLQNMLWEKNYLLKTSINELKEENNNVRARVWNFEKENRKMQKQIDHWNLEKHPLLEGRAPYLDSSTMDKVFQDQDYSVVTMKMELARLARLMEARDQQISRKSAIASNSKHHEELVGGEIALEAKKLIRLITSDNSSCIEELKTIRDSVAENNRRILLLEEELSLVRSNYAGYLKEKELMEAPAEPELDLYKEMKLDLKPKAKQQQEPSSKLRGEVDYQQLVIADLEFNMQEIINASLTQKQELRRQIKELERQCPFAEEYNDI